MTAMAALRAPIDAFFHGCAGQRRSARSCAATGLTCLSRIRKICLSGRRSDPDRRLVPVLYLYRANSPYAAHHIRNGAAVQQINRPVTLITRHRADVAVVHGGRAKCLQRLVRLDMPVPRTVALSFDAVHRSPSARCPTWQRSWRLLATTPLLSCARPAEDPDWGGPSAVLNIGMNDARYAHVHTDGQWRPPHFICVSCRSYADPCGAAGPRDV